MNLSPKNNAPLRVVAAILHREQKVLIVRRGPGMSGAGSWEFPGGKVEPGESEKQALEREILEELGVRCKVEDFLAETIHQYPTKKIQLRFYWATLQDLNIHLSEHDQLEWLSPHDLDTSRLSEADRPIALELRQHPRFQKKF